ETENALIDLNFLGIDNVVVLRGDARKGDRDFVPTAGGGAYAAELLKQVVDLNRGKSLHADLESYAITDFRIRVAGYPEKHFEAPNFNTDFKWLKKKVEMGAEFIVTQMFFNVQKYKEFVTKCRDHGIHVPIIPGLKPLTTKRQLITLPKIFHLDIPEELSEAVENCTNNADVRHVGEECLVEQCKGRIKCDALVLYFYTMSNPGPTMKSVERLG